MNNSKTSAPTPTPATRMLASDSKQRLVYLTVSNELRDIRAKQQIMRNLDQIQRNAEYEESCIRIEISKDGDQWCALIGENLQEGVAGFGAKPMAALRQLVIVHGAECARELAQQATKLMHGGKLVENTIQGLAAEMAEHYMKMGVPDASPSAMDEKMAQAGLLTEKERVEMEIARQKLDSAEILARYSIEAIAAMPETPVKPIGHFARVLRAIAERFVRQHVPTDSDDAYERLVEQLITMMTETLVPLQSPEVYGQPTPAFVRLREENASLVQDVANLRNGVAYANERREHYRVQAAEARLANIKLSEMVDQLTKERDAYQKDRDHALAQLDGANSRVVAERAVAEEQSNARETATKELIDVRARLSQAMTHNDQQRHLLETQGSTIGQLRKEIADAIAQRQTAWDELRRVRPGARLASFTKPVLVPHANSGSVASPTPPEFPKICVPSDNFFHSAACEYLKLRGESVVNSVQVAHEAGRIRDQFLRDRAVTATSIARTS